MKCAWNIFMVIVLMAGAGVVGFFIGHHAASPAQTQDADSDDPVDPVPTVQTATIHNGHVDRIISAYGSVSAQNADVSVLSVAFEARVKKVLAIPGQRLGPHTPVIDLEPSEDTQLQLLQARSAAQAAQTDLTQTRQRFNDHLATNADLLLSQQTLQQAQLKLDSFEKAGATGDLELKAAGLVSKVDVQQGQVVPAGTPLVEINSGLAQQINLGVEPVDAAAIHIGDPVILTPLGTEGSNIQARVQMIAQQIDPQTRLINVMVSLPPNTSLPLDVYMKGEIDLPTSGGLVVPRAAVLPDDQGYSVFTVDGQKAVEHHVTIAGQDDQSAQITGDDLAAGQSVVITGNMELEDGMSVKTQADTAGQSTTQPTAQEAAQ
jgi:membrane fusion protein, multidrug efflux system